jgi:hypothetical protein
MDETLMDQEREGARGPSRNDDEEESTRAERR